MKELKYINECCLEINYDKTDAFINLIAGRISSRRPTAAPPFRWMFEGGGGGAKPRITTVTTASVSVLAESDVLLPCKATGNPEPNIAWMKVSTGKAQFTVCSIFSSGLVLNRFAIY